MKITTINEYQKAALRTVNREKLSDTELLTNGVLGLSGESGECADLVKKHLFQGHELDTDKLANELGGCCVVFSRNSKGYRNGPRNSPANECRQAL